MYTCRQAKCKVETLPSQAPIAEPPRCVQPHPSTVISRKTPLLLGRGSKASALVMAEPAARCGHVAAAVEDKVYVWGGRRGRIVFHDDPDRAEIRYGVDILDVNVSIYTHRYYIRETRVIP